MDQEIFILTFFKQFYLVKIRFNDIVKEREKL